MNSKFLFYKNTQQNVRNFVTFCFLNSKNHYDSLGITPKASQKDVKEAYYKLSKVYHPDKNEGSEEASKKFRQVSEAYEILGNVKLRKLYDRGAHNIGKQNQYEPKQSHNERFHRSHQRRSRPPPPSGSTPIYDFDEWSKAHYGATFARDMYFKNMVNMQRMKRKRDLNDIKVERVLLLIVTFFFTTFFVISHEITSSQDIPKISSTHFTKRPGD